MRISAFLTLLLISTAPAQEFTPQQIELGRKLFFDPRLSFDNTISCATCHNPDTGFTDQQILAVGIRGQVGPRHTPTILGTFDHPLQFWDGRTQGIQLQALQPLVNDQEMGNPNTDYVVDKLNSIRGYRTLFQQAYGGRVNERRLSHAIAAFESTCVSRDAPVDRRLAGYSRALSEQAERGFQIFQDKGCMECHRPDNDFTDMAFHNTGVIYMTAGIDAEDQGRIEVLPQGSPRTPETVRAIKTPTLREVWQTAPYMHNGTILTLEDVVDGYNVAWRKRVKDERGRIFSRRDNFQDERIRPLGLSQSQKEDLVAFLKEGFRSEKYPKIVMPGLPK